MTKRVFSAVAGVFALCLSLPAQAQGPVSLLDYPTVQSPWASLDSHDRFFFSTAFGSMRHSEDYLPVFDPDEPLSYSAPYTSDNKSSLDRAVELRPPDRFYYGGEIGFLYGKSTGKYGREDYAGYILGTIGNDKFQITAGYMRQETNWTVPRRRGR